ncbi:DedA family protein, partial [Candidatus Erwinia haradaeae]
WQHDYTILTDPSLVWSLYFTLFMILFLENGLIPASFLPGDSLLILVGVLVAKGIMNGIIILLLLTLASALGCWLSYIQGKWLGNTMIVKKWLSYLPQHYHQKANHLFCKYGFSALIISRFIAFVRTLLPIIAGLSSLNDIKFQFFNWTSAFIWVLVLILAGFLIGNTKIFYYYEAQFMFILIFLPLILMLFSLTSIIYFLLRYNISEKK